VPKGFAHGFLTLKPDTTAFYMVDAFYTPERRDVACASTIPPGSTRGSRPRTRRLAAVTEMLFRRLSPGPELAPAVSAAAKTEIISTISMMMILDTALKKRAAEGNPIRVGMIGVGFIGRGLRHPARQPGAGHDAGGDRQPHAQKAVAPMTRPGGRGRSKRHADALEDADPRGPAGGDLRLRRFCANSGQIDVILELTGAITFGAESRWRPSRAASIS
jgi:hypothetical protein